MLLWALSVARERSNIRIGRDNVAERPGAETLLRRAANSTRNDPVFTVRTPVGGDGIHGEASGNSTGVQGTSPGEGGAGVHGINDRGVGVRGSSSEGNGVRDYPVLLYWQENAKEGS